MAQLPGELLPPSTSPHTCKSRLTSAMHQHQKEAQEIKSNLLDNLLACLSDQAQCIWSTEEGQEGNGLMGPEGSTGSSGEKQWVKKQWWSGGDMEEAEGMACGRSRCLQFCFCAGTEWHWPLQLQGFFPVKLEHPSKIRYSSGLLPEECL